MWWRRRGKGEAADPERGSDRNGSGGGPSVPGADPPDAAGGSAAGDGMGAGGKGRSSDPSGAGGGRSHGRRGRRGTWRTIRPDYQRLPREEWTEDEAAHWWATCSEEEYWAEWERWSQDTFDHPRIRRVRASCLDMALEAARETDAMATSDAAAAGRMSRIDGEPPGAEFACLLKVEKDTITELVLLPGTISGDEHAIFDLWMQPVDKTVRGSLHSHPDTHPYPSDADFELFAAHGEIHIILCRPYGPDDWRAYMHDGTPCFLEVIEDR